MARADGREANEMRRVEFEPGFTTNPAGSVLVRFGRTMVLCTASVEDRVPHFRVGKGGWLTAEYAMAPGSTHQRSQRESARGRLQGRTQEIQRLIGRSIRAAVHLDALGEHTVHLDCEVLQADGGTRTASVTGAWVAFALAVDALLVDGALSESVVAEQIAAISCGVVDGRCLVDLPYEEDVRAEVDANLVMTGAGEFVEIQATGEGGTLGRAALNEMLDAGADAIRLLHEMQREVLGRDRCARLGLREPGDA